MEGGAALHFLAWVSMRRCLEECWVLQENVEGFQPSVLEELLGDIYNISTIVVCPTMYGWPVSRRRRYTLLTHKKKALNLPLELREFMCLFQVQSNPLPTLAPSWDTFMVATLRELREELLWALRRPESQWTDISGTEGSLHLLTDDGSHGIFWKCLTLSESSFLKSYAQQFPQMAYSLNQDPSFSATRSTWSAMHTFIKSANIVWSLVVDSAHKL